MISIMNTESKDVSKTTAQEAYSQALETAQRELASLRDERQKIDRRIASLEQSVKGLAAVCEEQRVETEAPMGSLSDMVTGDIAGLGLTNAIRKVLSSRKVALVPTEIRDALVESGMDLSKYSNAMVAIHNTLKRLYDQRELARSTDEPTRYLWLNDMYKFSQMAALATMALQPTHVPKDFETR